MRAGLRAILFAAALATSAGWPISVTLAQQSAVFVDDSVAATESMLRIPELVAAGNLAEAARVAQSLLDTEADRVVASTSDPSLYVSVRARVHDLLLADHQLLEKYIAAEEPRAQRLFSTGKHAAAEHTRFLTPSGFDSAVRVAQQHTESARFDAAFISLVQLDRHPNRKSDANRAKACAVVAAELARYLDTDAARELARRYAVDAKAHENPGTRVLAPAASLALSRDATTPAGPLTVSEIARQPLAWIWLSRPEQPATRAAGAQFLPASRTLPAVVGDTVYLNDGLSVGAFDRATLVPLWRFMANSNPDETDGGEDTPRIPIDIAARQFEECSSITVGSGMVVATTGFAVNNYRRESDSRTHAVDAKTGRPLWSIDISQLDKQFVEASVRGAALLSGDTVVLTANKLTSGRRIASSFMVGLDASTGALRWTRPLVNVGISLYSRSSRVADMATLNAGIVYKADALGVIAAIEAATGRPVWVRSTPTLAQDDFGRSVTAGDHQPWSGSIPIVDGSSLIVIEPGTGDIVRLSLATGAVLDRRHAETAGSPKYLVKVGQTLAAVGTSVVNFIPLADIGKGQSRLGPSFKDPGSAGRAFACGSSLAVPVLGGISLMDPANPDQASFVELAESGNAVVAGGQLVVATPTRLTSHLSWDAAEPRLRGWMAERPDDPAPCLTYIGVASRAGKLAGLPQVADALLSIVDADPANPARQSARRELFRSLLGIVRTAQHPEPGSPSPDLSTIDPLVARLARAADTAEERASQLLVAAWIHESLGRIAAAIESFQQILQDTELADAAVDPAVGVAPGGFAWNVAHDRLADCLGRVGYRPYEAFAAQAARELAGLGAAPKASELEQLARRFPLSPSAPTALLAAAELRSAKNEAALRSANLGAAVDSAFIIARLNRQAPLDELGAAAGTLVDHLVATGRSGSAERLLRRLSAELPTLRLGSLPAPRDPALVLATLRGTLGAADRRPDLRGTPDRRTQTLVGWTMAKTRLNTGPGRATDQLAMYSLSDRVAALWAPRAEDGALVPLWSRSYEGTDRPTFLRTNWDSSFLFWPAGPTGPSLERVGTEGSTLWHTPGFDSLFPPDPDLPQANGQAANGDLKITTPLEGDVERASIVAVMDAQTAILIQRAGRAVGIDVASGKVLWAKSLDLTGVFDATLVNGRLVAIGYGSHESNAMIVVIDARSGQVGVTLGTPDAPLKSRTRWVRSVDSLAVIGLEASVIAIDPANAELKWNLTGTNAQSTLDAWPIEQQIVLLTSSQRFYRINALTGESRPEPLDTARRIGSIENDRPVDEVANEVLALSGGATAIVSENGVVCHDSNGKVVGFDAAGPEAAHRLFSAGYESVAMIDSSSSAPRGERRGVGIRLVSLPSGKTRVRERIELFDSPSAIAAIDGHVAISAGPLTVVLTLNPNP